MQLGSFYEMCAVLEGSQTYGETNIYEICDNLLNIAVAKRKTKPVNRVYLRVIQFTIYKPDFLCHPEKNTFLFC